MADDEAGQKSTLAAFVANLGIAAGKFIVYLISGSASMLAESVHSLADTSNQGLLLFGRRKSKRPPTDRHPFGYGRERYFWAFVVALVLFSAGGLFALTEGVQKLQNPHELGSPKWAIIALLLALVLESYSLRTAMKESESFRNEGESWLRFVKRTGIPELAVILIEDSGAIIGVLLALASTIVAALTGNPRFDAVGSVAIGVLLVGSAFTLAREMKSFLIGEAAQSVDRETITRTILADDVVLAIDELRTEQIGPDEILVVGTLLVAHVDGPMIYEARTRIENAVREAVPAAKALYLRARPNGET